MEIDAQRAIYSKRVGATADYNVIARSSGPWSDDALQAAFRKIVVGNLSSEAPEARAQGIFSIASGLHTTGTEAWLMIVRQEETGLLDWSDRSFTASSGICLPLLARPGQPLLLGYRQLADILLAHTWKDALSTDTLPNVQVPYAGEAKWLDDVHVRFQDEHVFRRCAAIASALIADPGISLVDRARVSDTPWPRSPLDRLWWIDFAMNLLPFGCRMRFAASTWAANSGGNTVQLTFSSQANGGSRKVIGWDELGQADRLTGFAKTYYDALLEIHVRHGGAGQLVKHLAGQTSPMDLEQHERIRDSLLPLYQPILDLRTARTATSDSATLHRVLGNRHLKLSLADRRQMFGNLLRLAQTERDGLDIAQYWDPSYWDDLVEAGQRRTGANVATALLPLIALAGAPGVQRLGGFLADVLLSGSTPVDPDSAYAVLMRRPQAIEQDQDHALRAKVRTRDVLPGFLVVVAEHAAQPGSAASARTWLDFLCGQAITGEQAWPAAAYGALARTVMGIDTDDLSGDQVRAVADVDVRHLERFITVAVGAVDTHPARLERLLPGLTAWRADASAAGSVQPAAGQLRFDAPLTASFRFKARLDVYRLVTVAGDDAWLQHAYLRIALEEASSLDSYVQALRAQLIAMDDDGHELASRLARIVTQLDVRSRTVADNLVILLAALEDFRLPKGTRDEMQRLLDSLGPSTPAPLPGQGRMTMRELAAAFADAADIPAIATMSARLLYADPDALTGIVDALGRTGMFEGYRTWDDFVSRIVRHWRDWSAEPDALAVLESRLANEGIRNRHLVNDEQAYLRHLFEQRLHHALHELSVYGPILAPYIQDDEKKRLSIAIKNIADAFAQPPKGRIRLRRR